MRTDRFIIWTYITQRTNKQIYRSNNFFVHILDSRMNKTAIINIETIIINRTKSLPLFVSRIERIIFYFIFFFSFLLATNWLNVNTERERDRERRTTAKKTSISKYPITAVNLIVNNWNQSVFCFKDTFQSYIVHTTTQQQQQQKNAATQWLFLYQPHTDKATYIICVGFFLSILFSFLCVCALLLQIVCLPATLLLFTNACECLFWMRTTFLVP